MGHNKRRTPNNKRKINAKDKQRKVTKTGGIKRKRGDYHMITSRAVGYKVKQKKGGQWVRATGQRVCKIHTVCNCVSKTDVSKQRFIKNR